MKFKKIGKIATLAVTLGVAGAVGFGAATPNGMVFADDYTSVASEGSKIQITTLKTHYSADEIKKNELLGNANAGKNYIVLSAPTLAAGDGDLNIKATNSAGKAATVVKENLGDGEGWHLYLSNDKGDYYVTYSVVNTAGYTTESKNVLVSIEATEPGFVFDSNSAQIIPSKINPTKSFDVPYPSIVNESKTTEDDVVYMTYDDGVSVIDLTAANIAAIKNATKIANIGLTLKLKDSTNALRDDCLVYDATTGFYKVVLPANAPTGKWTLTYTYTGTNTFSEQKVYQFQVLSTEYFNPDEDVTLKISGFKDSKSIPSSMELNVASQFPYLNVINSEDGNSITTYQVLTLTCSPADGTADRSWNSKDNPAMFDDFKFTPTVAGDYGVSYTVYDAYGHSLSHTYSTIGSVKKGTTGTEVFLVEGYVVDEVKDLRTDDLEEAFYGDTPVLVKADYMIPSKVAVSDVQTFNLPAIFAIDLTDHYESLKFYRRITDPDNNTVTYSAYEAESTGRKVNPEDPIEYKFTKAGTYSIRYYVIDSEYQTTYYNTVTVTVEDGFVDEDDPTVEYVGLPSSVIAGNSFTFSVDAQDYAHDSTTEFVDTNLKVVVKYTLGTEVVDKQIYPSSEGVYTIEVPADTAADEVNITVTATDDYGRSTPRLETVSVKSYAGDVNPPVISAKLNFDIDTLGSCWSGTVNAGVLTLNNKIKGDFVTLPSITFEDIESDNLSVTAYVEHVGTGNIIKTFSQMSGSAKTATMGGLDSESFQLSYAGNYRVNYVATDANNNILLYSFQFSVESNTPPSIYGVGNISTEAEYGDVIDIVSGITIYDNDTVQAGYSTKIITAGEYADIDATLAAADNETLLVYIEGAYTPKTADQNKIVAGSGAIKLYYWAKNAAGYFITTPQTQTITSKDTKAPTFYVDETKMDVTHDYDSQASSATSLTNYVFIADMEALKDTGIGVDLSSKSITAKYSDTSTELTLKTDIATLPLNLFDGDTDAEKEADRAGYAEKYYGYVIATKNGTIDVTYSLSDKAGNSAATKTISIACGDITAPSISISDVPFATSYNVGDTLSIDRTKIKVSDDADTEISYTDVSITVTCDGQTVSRTNSSASDEVYTYSIANAGNYVITFTATDEAGNQSSTTKEFTVNAVPESPAVSTTVWGTILIIAALLVLGGVIYFFVKPSKGKGSKKKAEKKEPEEKLEV